MSNTLIVIPVRMASKRFPGKPLVLIEEKTMLEHVVDRAIESKVGDVLVACCDKEIKNLMEKRKIKYVMTNKKLISGTDRVFSAYNSFKNKKKYENIINLQGDVPFINCSHISKLNSLIKGELMEIATLVSEIKSKKKISDVNIVKTIISKHKKKYYKALYFSRLPVPFNSNKYYEHVGIYAYTIKALKKFVSLGRSNLEEQENLEQLRALDNNMDIIVAKIKKAPISIDTPEDLILLNKSRDKK